MTGRGLALLGATVITVTGLALALYWTATAPVGESPASASVRAAEQPSRKGDAPVGRVQPMKAGALRSRREFKRPDRISQLRSIDPAVRLVRRPTLIGKQGDDGDPERVPWPADEDGIRSAMGEATTEVRDCVEGYGPEVGAFDGDVVVSFTITGSESADGAAELGSVSVTGADAAGGGVPPVVQRCVTSVFADLRFEPQTDGPLVINYPWHLTY